MLRGLTMSANSIKGNKIPQAGPVLISVQIPLIHSLNFHAWDMFFQFYFIENLGRSRKIGMR